MLLGLLSFYLSSVEFIQVVKDFEDFRKKCQRTNQELEKFKDLLLKAETGRSALDVKLKHARNQVDVEIKRRQRAEAECAKLVCIALRIRLVMAWEDSVDNVFIYPVPPYVNN